MYWEKEVKEKQKNKSPYIKGSYFEYNLFYIALI